MKIIEGKDWSWTKNTTIWKIIGVGLTRFVSDKIRNVITVRLCNCFGLRSFRFFVSFLDSCRSAVCSLSHERVKYNTHQSNSHRYTYLQPNLPTYWDFHNMHMHASKIQGTFDTWKVLRYLYSCIDIHTKNQDYQEYDLKCYPYSYVLYMFLG